MDFPRLINAMDEIARTSDEEVIIQTGMGSTKPEYASHFDFRDRDEVRSLQGRARMIVCHAGIGALQDALAAQKPFAIVPRFERHGEHMNDHQLDLARIARARGWGRMVTDVAELAVICASPPPTPTGYRPASATLINAIHDDILHLTGASA